VDTTPPIGTILISDGAAYTNSLSVMLSLSATDNSGIVSQMQFSNDDVTYSSPEPYATTKTWTLLDGDGEKTVFVKFKDADGNWSEPVSDTINLDTVAPNLVILYPEDGLLLSDFTERMDSFKNKGALGEIR